MLKFLNYKHLLFFLVIALQMVIYNYPYLAGIEPRNIHAWRQYDCLSFAQSFYNDRATFFEPAVNNLGDNVSGKAASDFPIIQFAIGKLWKITGMHSLIYRLVNIFLLIWGLFYVYKLFFEEFKNKAFAVLFAALIFTSGNISYYGISTLSDIQAFSLSLVAFYFFYNWLKHNNSLHFYFAVGLFALAGLLKASSAISYLLCILYFVFDKIEKKEMKAFLTKKNSVKIAYLFLPFILWFVWFNYAKNYNIKHNNGFFLVGVLPLWDMPAQAINDNLRSLIYNLLPQVINPFILFFILTFIVANSFLNLKKQLAPSLILISSLAFFVIYIILFFGAFDVHDYYLINMVSVLVIALFFIAKICFNQPGFLNMKYVLFVLGFIVIMNTYLNGVKIWKKTNSNVTSFENSIVFNSFEQQNIFWIYWFDREKYKALENKELNLEKIGVLKSDTIFCLGDETINRSLYLMNRVGYTNFNTDTSNFGNFVNTHHNIKYVVLIDTVLKRSKVLMNALPNKIYDKGSLSVYKLK